MTERSWIFSLVALLTIFLSYEVFAGKGFGREQLILNDWTDRHFSGVYMQKDSKLTFQVSVDQQDILVFVIQMPQREHRGLVSLTNLSLVSSPIQGDLDAIEKALLFDFVEALKADVAATDEPVPETLASLIGALSYWVMRAPSSV
jgi:hypothetical protein